MLWLAVCCVALMPSIYKGGAAMPHPHSFFQFWLSGPDAAFDHHQHHGAMDGASMGAGAHLHVHYPGMAMGAETGEIVTSRCGAMADFTAFCATSATSGTASTGTAAGDVVRISPQMPPGGTIEGIVAVAFGALLALALAVRRWRFPAPLVAWHERRGSPDVPPPRSVFVPAFLGV